MKLLYIYFPGAKCCTYLPPMQCCQNQEWDHQTTRLDGSLTAGMVRQVDLHFQN